MTTPVISRLILRIATLLMVCVTEAFAQTPNPKQYFEINPPELTSTTDKLEVVEVFSYACIHCAHFAPLVEQWRKRLNTAKVEFVFLPAPYNPVYALLARGFYAANSLDVVDKTHQGVFDAIHLNGASIQSFDNVVSIYAKLGVPREDFIKAANSFLVEAQLRRANDLMLKYRIDGTPTLIVAGKYRITAESAGSQENMFVIADQLIAKELGKR
jgi:protein dithiol oxidoreductase (disulfide-forming)